MKTIKNANNTNQKLEQKVIQNKVSGLELV